MYAGVSRVTSRGQVTLPQTMREEEGITEGSEVIFFKTEQGIVILTNKELDSMFGLFSEKGRKLGLTREKLAEEVKELRKKK